ncbi:hypothetical protein [Ruminiclostridium herbifermentans]|nr:hypothetical protein [Ruminiclostridium herbifermentans]
MTEEIIQNLREALIKHECTLKKASFDKCSVSYMCESKLKVINFDKIPKEYSKEKHLPCLPASNDALYISKDGSWYFIEFKNGSIDRADLFRKIYDSIIMLLELGIIPDFDFARKNISYILVYNSDKYPKIQKSESREENFSYFMRLAKTEEKLFEVEKLEKYLLKETHTYSKELFNTKFIIPMESIEGMAVTR